MLTSTSFRDKSNSTLSLPFLPFPGQAQDYMKQCIERETQPFIGGQLLYSLLSELSALWTSSEERPMHLPINVRNVPFYNIHLLIKSIPGSPGMNLQQVVMFIYSFLHIYLRSDRPWPRPVDCELFYKQTRVGEMAIELLDPRPFEAVNSTKFSRNVTSALDATSLGANNHRIEILPNFEGGKRTTDKNILYLFVLHLGWMWARSTDAIPTVDQQVRRIMQSSNCGPPHLLCDY